MYSIEVKIQFRAGHRLMAPYTGKCNNLHGEGFIAIFILQREDLDVNKMVADFGFVRNLLKTWIDRNLDHAFICNQKDSTVIKFLEEEGFKYYIIGGNPTSENIAYLLLQTANRLIASKVGFGITGSVVVRKVGVIESFDDSIAWYEREA